MSLHLHECLHVSFVCSGIALNLTTIAIILIKTSNELKEYSILLLNTSFIELLSTIAFFLINCRLFVHKATAISISEGPCAIISDDFCMIVTCFSHINMIYSNFIIALSFWYRKRVLREKGDFGKYRLQLIILLLFVPHLFHIALAAHSASPREILEPIVESFYGPNSTVGYGLHGTIDGFVFEPAVVLAYLVFVPVYSNSYIIYGRITLLAMMRDKMRHMSTKTRGIHESLTKVLTISAASSSVLSPLFIIGSVIAQVGFRLHSVDIEGLVYHGAVMPALVNPALTLYFVKTYRLFIMSFFTRQTHKVSSTTPSTGVQFTV